MDNQPVSTLQFQNTATGKTLQRVGWKLNRMSWAYWTLRAIFYWIMLLICSMVVTDFVATMMSYDVGFSTMFLPALSISFGAAVVLVTVAISTSVVYFEQLHSVPKKPLELRANGLAALSPLDIEIVIPWHAMKSAIESADGWILRDGMVYYLVFREALQKAGLEDEFRRRIADSVSPPKEAAR
ncbi:MAG: hypothetical protein JNJ45_05045 [Chthonomonas sp.]|nr:hypothetical protein [Chthonomonas sp.]